VPPPAGTQPLPALPSSFGTYREQTSRVLFATCDLNGDDHITPLEAFKTLKGIDREKFRSYDTNKDGRLQFDEFDRHFQRRARYGGQLAITELALRLLATRSNALQTVDRTLAGWFASLDKDGNDRLDFAEWKVLGELLDKDPKAVFVSLDKDLSNSLTVAELEPMLPKISLLDRAAERARKAKRPLRPLPEGFQVADLSRDGLLDLEEIGRALQRIHPTLVRHAELILIAADQDRDRHLNVFEIEAIDLIRGRTKPRR
jgi:Ca2+-binding EF-hand superfamily protein